MPFKSAAVAESSFEKNKAVMESVLGNATNLADVFRADFAAYYGKDINTPRVKAFLEWLEKNGVELMKELRKNMVMPDGEFAALHEMDSHIDRQAAYALIGIWLGEKYVLDTFGVDRKKRHQVKISTAPDLGGFELPNKDGLVKKTGPGRGIIAFGALLGFDHTYRDIIFRTQNDKSKPKERRPEIETMCMTANCGIHETTHMLPYIKTGRSDAILSEFATAIASDKCCLPIKSEALTGNRAFGARGWRHQVDEAKEGRLEYWDRAIDGEYLSFKCLPWIRSYLHRTTNEKLDPAKYEIKYRGMNSDYEPEFDGNFSLGAVGKYLNGAGLSGTKEGELLRPALCEVADRVQELVKMGQEVKVKEFDRIFIEVMDAHFGKPETNVPDTFGGIVPVKNRFRSVT